LEALFLKVARPDRRLISTSAVGVSTSQQDRGENLYEILAHPTKLEVRQIQIQSWITAVHHQPSTVINTISHPRPRLIVLPYVVKDPQKAPAVVKEPQNGKEPDTGSYREAWRMHNETPHKAVFSVIANLATSVKKTPTDTRGCSCSAGCVHRKLD
jgi:hypothetical protein